MKINSQLNIQATANHNLYSKQAEKQQAPAQRYEQMNDYGKNLNFTGLRNMRISSNALGKISHKISNTIPFGVSINKAFVEDYKTAYPAFSQQVDLIYMLRIGKKAKLGSNSRGFLIDLMKKGQADSFKAFSDVNEAKTQEMNSVDNIITLFERVKNPTKEHADYLHNSDLSLSEVKDCFDACNDNPLKLKKLETVGKDIKTSFQKRNEFDTKASHKVFMDFVKSPNMSEYLRDYDTLYKEHLAKGIRNRDENVIATLDKLHNNKNLAQVKDTENLTYAFKALSEKSEGAMKLEDFTPYQSAEGDELLDVLGTRFMPKKETIEKYGDKDYVDIYRTTNKDNLKFREDFISNNYIHVAFQKDANENEIKSVNKLFQKADENKYAKKFISKVTDTGFQVNTAEDLVTLLDKYDPKELNKNFGKISKMLYPGHQETYMKDITELMDKKANKKSAGTAISDFFGGLFGKKAKSVETPLDEYEVAEPVAPKVSVPRQRSHAVKVKGEPLNFSLADTNKQKLMGIMTNSPSNTMSKKLKVAQDSVSPLLKKTIKSDRVLNEQEYLYTINTTKMRANMLPDIFESIKATRAEAKAANGGKLPKGFVKNEDALELYTKINGKNKKLVNYMLKQTKKDATGKTVRAFNVKDIINTLDDAHREAFQAKKAAPSGTKFTAKDEKAIYARKLDSLKSEYGELPKQPRVNKTK